MHPKHSTKKLFERASTRKKTIETGISAEFTDYRQRLTALSKTLQSLQKEINTTRQIWDKVGKHQRTFTETLATGLPQQGFVHTHAGEVKSHLCDLQRLLNEKDVGDAPHHKIATVLQAYLQLIEGVEAEYPTAETSYTEMARYQRKVDSLEKKKKRKQEVLTRNLNKLTTARQDHDHKIAQLVHNMRQVYNKHEVVFQCAHHAFWLANHTYATAIHDMTADIRAESLTTVPKFLAIDVNGTPALQPVPRVELIESRVTVESVDSKEDVRNAVSDIPDVPTDSPTPPAATTVIAKVTEKEDKPSMAMSSAPAPVAAA